MSRSREHFQSKAPSHPYLKELEKPFLLWMLGNGRETGDAGVGSRWSESDSPCVDNGWFPAGDAILKLPASRCVTSSRASPSFLSRLLFLCLQIKGSRAVREQAPPSGLSQGLECVCGEPAVSVVNSGGPCRG